MGRKELEQVITLIRGRYSAGKATTAHDVRKRFGWSFKQAQNKLEYLREQGRIFTPFKKTNPQKYYPPTALEKVSSMGTDSAIELRNFQNLLMNQGRGAPLLVHNIQLLTQIESSFYSTYFELKPEIGNLGKRFHANIDGNHVWAFLSPNGTIQIFACLSLKPFRLGNDGDIDKILISLGEWRRGLIDDGLPFDLPDPSYWVTTHLDFNKDIRKKKADFTIDMHQTIDRMTYMFRIYTKFIENHLVYRMELSKDFNDKSKVSDGLRWGLNEANDKLMKEVSNLAVQTEESTRIIESRSASGKVDDKNEDSVVRENP